VLWPKAAEQPPLRERRARADVHPEDEELGSRFADLDEQAESPFLRSQKRVPVRRGPVTRKTANRLRQAITLLMVMFLMGAAALAFYRYGSTAARFRIRSADQIAIAGTRNVARAQVMEFFAPDISHNAFSVPLDTREAQIEKIAWVEDASVMRLLPNRISVEIKERIPIAFAQAGARILLIDANGVLLEPAKAAHYSFPVIAGMSDNEPRSTRAARMMIYQRLIRELDSGGARYSQNISEVDLSDPEDARVTVTDDVGAVLVHLGSEKFLERFKTYIAHVAAWRQQFRKLDSVDLRFDQQVIVNPDSSVQATGVNSAPSPRTSTAAPKKTAGHKPAARRRHPVRPRRNAGAVND
jgi:cell division protein FtsQ